MWKLLTLAIFAALAAAPDLGHAFGALAVDSNKAHSYGYSYGYSSQRGADARALSECGSGCYVAVRFNGTCAAYAADMRPSGTAWGWGAQNSAQGAQARALSECRARAGYGSQRVCQVRVWGCDR